jgi:GNAT superfamily N-acetyltransferase
VSRAPVVVRSAVPQDASALLEVWPLTRTDAAAPGDAAVAPDEARMREASACIAQIATDPEEELLVADSDGVVMGAVHLRRARLSPVQLAEAVQVSHLQVHPRHRRRGIASALLAAATAWAEAKDSAHLLAVAPSSSREAHRFPGQAGLRARSVSSGHAPRPRCATASRPPWCRGTPIDCWRLGAPAAPPRAAGSQLSAGRPRKAQPPSGWPIWRRTKLSDPAARVLAWLVPT